MNRIDATFSSLRRENRKALIAYLTVGFPKVSLLPDLVAAVIDSGVDLMELGIPFSDPLADGPTIQAASSWALRQGVTPRIVLRQVEGLRHRGIRVPLALMTYINPVHRYGIEAFCRDSASCGVDGLIVPDLPPEEAVDLIRAAQQFGLDTIFLAAPTSPHWRLRRIVQASSGFIYDVSLTGVTGARSSLSREVAGHVRSIQRMTDLPVCVGFGIARPAQVREVARVADGVIIGSRLLEVIGAGQSPIKAASTFIRKLREACHA